MRSRNGSHSFRCAILIIFISSLALNAKEYLISYRYVVKDAILYNETLSISSSMTKCLGKPLKALTINSFGDKNLRKSISNNSQLFVDYIHTLGLHLEHNGLTKNYQNTSTTILTLKTTCFKVDFNDNLVKIAPLK